MPGQWLNTLAAASTSSPLSRAFQGSRRWYWMRRAERSASSERHMPPSNNTLEPAAWARRPIAGVSGPRLSVSVSQARPGVLETPTIGGKHERPGTTDYDVAGSTERYPGLRRHAGPRA